MSTKVSRNDYTSYWEKTWAGGIQPGQVFDVGVAAPILKEILDAEQQLDNKSALVPGCGRGYDVVEFARHGCKALGLEIAQSAVKAAQLHADNSDLGSSRDLATFEEGDFFHHPHQYDYGYDYTFMCSFVPERRQDWAEAWGRLIRPGGELITLIFPVGLGAEDPPPFDVTPEDYEQLLSPQGFQNIQLEKLPDHMSHQDWRAGKEWIARWRKTAASL